MELKQIILYLCVCGVTCFPSKPLNDRPSELAWQAWLLVDAQNPNEGDRRITPKSVFIAPNIGGGDNGSGSGLPECAEGYRSDPMGRCIKFVKVDEAAHLDFLLQRLNAMYATRPTQDLDDDIKPTTGPLQVNIPLGGSGLGFPSLEDQKDPEIAIIVAPTNGNFDADEEKEVKFDKRTQDKSNNDDKKEEETTTHPPPTETTTANEDVTTTTESTTTESATTSDDLQALFFLVPMNKTDHVPNNRTAGDILKLATRATPVAQTSTEAQQTNTEVESDADPDNSTPLDDGDIDPPAIQVKGKPDLETKFTVEDVASVFEPLASDSHSASLVRFPGNRDTSTTVRFPGNAESSETYGFRDQPKLPLIPEAHRLTSGEIEHLFKEYISQKPDIVALTSTDHINRRRPVSEAAYLDGDEVVTQPQIQRPQQYFNPVFNHRNRDRSDFWRPASPWREETIQKPLVLRFNANRHPYSSERSSGEQQQQQQPQQVRYYEDRRPEEFSQVFGRKRRRGNLR